MLTLQTTLALAQVPSPVAQEMWGWLGGCQDFGNLEPLTGADINVVQSTAEHLTWHTGDVPWYHVEAWGTQLTIRGLTCTDGTRWLEVKTSDKVACRMVEAYVTLSSAKGTLLENL